jgi:hypothetical protein
MMPLDDPSDPSAETRRLKKRVERLEAGTADGGDSDHAGAGEDSIALGNEAESTGKASIAIGDGATATAGDTSGGGKSIAIGDGAWAVADRGIAIGNNTLVEHDSSVAIGDGATSDADDQIMLGTFNLQTKVPGPLVLREGSAPTSTGDFGLDWELRFDGDYGYINTSLGWKKFPLLSM